jgi:hypothetical protein
VNVFSKLTSYLQGRHTLFAVAFFVMGHVMHWYHRLDASYIAYMATLMGFVLGHSVKQSMLPEQTVDTTTQSSDASSSTSTTTSTNTPQMPQK